MRESVGGTWLFIIVIAIILIFSGYLAISINYSKAFNVKDEILKIIEDTGSISDDELPEEVNTEILERIAQVGYRSMNNCDEGWYGYDRNGTKTTGDDALYCIRKITKTECDEEKVRAVYYQLEVFYQLDLPVFNQLFKFKVRGDTKLLYETCEVES